MRTIKNYVEKIKEEIEGAKEYAEKYVEEKAKGEISKEKVLKNLEILSDEIKDFLKRLYRNTDMPEERNILSKTITEINVGNL